MAALLSHRLRLLNASRLNYIYSALFHRSPHLNAGIFDFGDDGSDSDSFLSNLYDTHSQLASLVLQEENSTVNDHFQSAKSGVVKSVQSEARSGLEHDAGKASNVDVVESQSSGECVSSTAYTSPSDVRAVSEIDRAVVESDIPAVGEIDRAVMESDVPAVSEIDVAVVESDVPAVGEIDRAVVESDVPAVGEIDRAVVESDVPAVGEIEVAVAESDVPAVGEIDVAVVEPPSSAENIRMDLKPIVDDSVEISKISKLVVDCAVPSEVQDVERPHLMTCPDEILSDGIEVTSSVDQLEPTAPDCQVPEETTDIKVGTLIGLMAAEGEDWKSVTIPASEEISSPSAPSVVPAAAVSAAGAALTSQGHRNFGPSVRLLLEQYGLTTDQVNHGGPHGILLKGDVLKMIKERNLQPKPLKTVPPPDAPKPAVPAAPPVPAGPAPKAIPGISEDGYEDLEITNIRRVIAKRLTQSKSGIAHSYGTLECRADELIGLRKQYKKDGVNVSINDIIIKAVAVALTMCPEMNCVWQGDQLLMSNEVDVSVAVATPAGLITPIIRGAEGIGIEEIASRVRELASRARENKLKPEEFQGGTFTISNLGMFGISEFSAIINPPQCGILAVGGSSLACDENGQPVSYMRATLSYDRAGVDDDTAAHFLDTLKSLLEDPTTLMLGSSGVVNHPMAALL